MTTRVFARIKSKPEHTVAVREILLELVTASRTEPGVIFYELFETREGGEFLVNEEYHDAAAFDAHLASPHFNAAGAKLQNLLALPVDIWNTVPANPNPDFSREHESEGHSFSCANKLQHKAERAANPIVRSKPPTRAPQRKPAAGRVGNGTKCCQVLIRSRSVVNHSP